jgi:hypothetical protein
VLAAASTRSAVAAPAAAAVGCAVDFDAFVDGRVAVDVDGRVNVDASPARAASPVGRCPIDPVKFGAQRLERN